LQGNKIETHIATLGRESESYTAIYRSRTEIHVISVRVDQPAYISAKERIVVLTFVCIICIIACSFQNNIRHRK